MTPDWALIHLFWRYGGEALAIIICTWAFWKGGKPERWGAAILAVGWGLSYMNVSHDGTGPGLITIIIDVVTAFAFIALALWSRRPWTFFMAACMVNALITHLVAKSLGLGIWAYVTLSGVWAGYALLACLGYGVWRHQSLTPQSTQPFGERQKAWLQALVRRPGRL